MSRHRSGATVATIAYSEFLTGRWHLPDTLTKAPSGYAIGCYGRIITVRTVLTRDVKASRSDWPRGQKFGLGLGLGLEVLASASRYSGHYRTSSQPSEPGTDEPSKQLLRYITYINSDTSDHSLSNWQNSITTFQCCSPCLIDCFASRQALLQSREFSRRAV